MPSELNTTDGRVKFADSPSIKKIRVGFSGFPFVSDKPVPLLEVSEPVTLKGSPGRGLAWIGSINMLTGDLTVIVFRIWTAGLRSPEPLNTKVTLTRPSGWS